MYSLIIGFTFMVLKIINFRLHHSLGSDPVPEELVKEKEEEEEEEEGDDERQVEKGEVAERIPEGKVVDLRIVYLLFRI